LERIGVLLTAKQVSFKGPATLEDLYCINSGLIYPYTQIGKIFTIYPRSDDKCRELAKQLDELTQHMLSPKVPFDLRFGSRSNVYYRYGAFSSSKSSSDENGEALVHNQRGELIVDRREIARPCWVKDLFEGAYSTNESKASVDSPLRNNYRVFRALAQRGKGGVYQAVDMTTQPPRLCLIKEGRKSGEVSWEGHDGKWRVKNERRMLRALKKVGIDVPEVYSAFEENDNFYLVTEFVHGESLQSYLSKRQRRLPLVTIIQYSIEIATIIASLHNAGWIWRDCKPANLLVSAGKLRPLDFEGACQISNPGRIPWISPSFCNPSHNLSSVLNDDLYALAAVIYLLLTGRMPDRGAPIPPKTLRRQIPEELSSFVTKLLKSETELSAAQICEKLKQCLVMTVRTRRYRMSAFTVRAA
jgi:serine/threonine protein kinase